MRRNTLLQSIIAAVLLSTSSVTFSAADFDEQSKKPLLNASEVTQLQQQAKDGYVQAQFQLARAYTGGVGINRDESQAIYWYEQAAEQGHVMAQYNLALMLEHGQGVQIDAQKAAALYMAAARQGHVGAQYSVGIMYLDGKGFEKNKVKAWSWLALAADNGYRNVDLVRDALREKLTAKAYQAAHQNFVQLKNQLPEAYPASLMILASAGK